MAASTQETLRTTEETIRACVFLGQVEGDSGYGKNANWKVLARHSANKRAEKLGANHLVWEKYDEKGSFNGAVTAKAYRCDES